MKKNISIYLDKKRHLRMTPGGLKGLKKDTGMSIDQWVKKFHDKPLDLKNLAIITRAYLIHEDENLTLKKMEEIIKNHCFEFDERADLCNSIFKANKLWAKELNRISGPALRTIKRRN